MKKEKYFDDTFFLNRYLRPRLPSVLEREEKLQVWERTPPSRNACCMCAKALKENEKVAEARPTGVAYSFQEWWWCLDCWLDAEERKELALAKINQAIQFNKTSYHLNLSHRKGVLQEAG